MCQTIQRPWFVYIVQTECKQLYTGISTDVERRFHEHCQVFEGISEKGAKYFRGKKPLAIVYRETYENRAEASKREYQIKKMSASKKRVLINTN